MEPVRYITIDEKPCERFERDPLFSLNSLLRIRYNGTYMEDDSGETITIQIANDQLLLRLHDDVSFRLLKMELYLLFLR